MSEDLEAGPDLSPAGESGQGRRRWACALPGLWSRYWTTALAVGLTLVFLTLGVGFLTWVDSASGGSAWVAAARSVWVDSLARWVTLHRGDLPWSASTLTATWWLLGAVLFVGSLVEIAVARIGWALFGAGTAAAVYAGTAAPAQPVAAATIAAAWLVLSHPALHGLGARRPPVTRGDRDAPWSPAAGLRLAGDPTGRGRADVQQPMDELAQVARTFELLLRRRAARARHAGTGRPRPQWTIHGGEGHAFTARCTDPGEAPATGVAASWDVAGLAFGPEALAEVLTLIHPAGTTPTLRWEREELRPGLWTRGMGTEPPGLPPIDQFLQDSRQQRARLVECLRELQASLTEQLGGKISLGTLSIRFDGTAARLNLSRPLIPDVHRLEPDDQHRSDVVGSAYFYDWVDVTTIVKTGGRREWNEFDDHRPDQVAVIARGLLGADPMLGEDLDAAVQYVLGEGGLLSLIRIPGPAGPIHEVASNGMHRTHAFALLDLPIIAAKVSVTAIPGTITASGAGFRHDDPDPAMLWRGLIRLGLLEGRIEDDESAWIPAAPQVLYPTWVAAPWMLLKPHDAAMTAGAYDRVYPGALRELGVPNDVLGNPAAWTTWLTATP